MIEEFKIIIIQTLTSLKTVTIETLTNIKTMGPVLLINFSNWYMEWGSPIINTMTSIGSFFVVILLARYHMVKTKKLELDIEDQLEARNK